MDNQRNILLAVALSALLILGWDGAMRYFYPQASISGQSEESAQPTAKDTPEKQAPKKRKRTREGGLSDPALVAEENKELSVALASAQRVKIDAPEVAGSINLVGARIDDLVLKTHRQTVKKDSGPVRLFSPAGTPAQHFAQFGWAGEGVELPGVNTVWSANGSVLSPETPVSLSWTNKAGQKFVITLSIDDRYMITARQTLVNSASGPVVVEPRVGIIRTSKTASLDSWNVHSGPIADVAGSVQFGPNYDDLADDSAEGKLDGQTDWLGFTDIYWLSAIIPQNPADASADFASLGKNRFVSRLFYKPLTVAAGKQVSRTTRLFAGAKESATLDAYEAQGVTKFGNAIDWGWFGWIARPIWWLLTHLYDLLGNFGLAIIALTVIVRGLMFPIAQKQFASMAGMKAVQPKMKAIQERYKDDKQKQQQEIMALYKKEGVNPLAGCLPTLLQIPIFFALYKTLILAIDMRHKPFYLWIQDLSAPDPAKILNLFGLLPFDPPGFLGIGVLAVLLGVTMWLTFRLNPSATDPMQRQIFSFMPWVLMFVMAPFAAGLLLYWVTSNLLTLAQQTYLYSKHPQLRAQAEKDRADREQAKLREDKGAKKGRS